ncbi:hypothetical protein [uncultured Flavobacterium sp.]|uniref:hypothetical protein n=1 Tax=uncultured Flavobacterium sp. TaxID=165435 RepID=UPI0025D04BAE|nr:hypothetical protein [uncultured Flavobacterium sp.]
MQSTVLHNQNLFDIAIQENGNVQTIFELSLLNGFSITDSISPASKIEVVKSDLIVQEIVDYLDNKELVVATGNADNLENKPVGIGAMIVGYDFIIG